ncbi:MAG TPA: SDR family oxidoreductase [Candidatus Polarisedimenticolia bacterium]|nr:SDR family oxidoreductase [Candidatus Polarisedimenticolia bacterium]
MDPKGKVALISGAARVGRSVAEALARRGCHVALTYNRSRDSAEEAAARVRALGPRALALRADLSAPKGAAAAVDAVRAKLGGPDILVGMASVYGKTPFAGLDEDAWRANLDVDLSSAFHLARRAAPIMKQAGSGRIVLLADWLPASGRPRYHGFLPYYVAKAGIIGLAESLALELAPEILVNSIAPGPILKPPGFSAKADRAVRRETPLGRWGGPEEIARAVVFLVETEFVTGECLRVDGGRHLR